MNYTSTRCHACGQYFGSGLLIRIAGAITLLASATLVGLTIGANIQIDRFNSMILDQDRCRAYRDYLRAVDDDQADKKARLDRRVDLLRRADGKSE